MILKHLTFVSFTAVALSLSGAASAAEWKVDDSQSTLGFEVKQGKGTLTGEFKEWSADIDFDPEAPEAAHIKAEIAPGSASTGNAQFDGTLPGADWFDVSSFPTATFETSDVKLVEGNSYTADGTLTIKGVSQPVVLDFTLDIDGDKAHAAGTATVDRSQYDLGAGVGTDTVGEAVTVTLDLTATR